MVNFPASLVGTGSVFSPVRRIWCCSSTLPWGSPLLTATASSPQAVSTQPSCSRRPSGLWSLSWSWPLFGALCRNAAYCRPLWPTPPCLGLETQGRNLAQLWGHILGFLFARGSLFDNTGFIYFLYFIFFFIPSGERVNIVPFLAGNKLALIYASIITVL